MRRSEDVLAMFRVKNDCGFRISESCAWRVWGRIKAVRGGDEGVHGVYALFGWVQGLWEINVLVRMQLG